MLFAAILIALVSLHTTLSANDLSLPNEEWFVSMLFDKYATNNVSLSLTDLENIMSLLGILNEHDDHYDHLNENYNNDLRQNFSLVIF
jgi:hypothetical protein